jgi:hypothetical protein
VETTEETEKPKLSKWVNLIFWSPGFHSKKVSFFCKFIINLNF